MLPLTFLAVMIALTAAAYILHLSIRERRAILLRKLASDWGMNYSKQDPFHLLPRIMAVFPMPGASDVSLVDMIYRQEAQWYRYLLTVEYTEGVVRTKKRNRRAVSFSEPRDRLGPAPVALLQTAPPELSIMQQYIRLHIAMSQANPSHATQPSADR